MENFNQLIPIDEGKGKKRTMTSLQIAEITGKTHSNVMRDIRNILEQLEDRRQFSFELSSRPQPMPNGGSKEVSCYILTKKDCLLLASVMMQTYEPKLLIVGKNLKKTSVNFPVKGRNLC